MQAIRVRGIHLNGRQPTDLNRNTPVISTFRQRDKSSSGGRRDKNTSARLCAKNTDGGGGGGVGAYARMGAYLRDTVVYYITWILYFASWGVMYSYQNICKIDKSFIVIKKFTI